MAQDGAIPGTRALLRLSGLFAATRARLDPAARTAAALDALAWAPAHTVVVAVGKAAPAMAAGALDHLQRRGLDLAGGVVVGVDGGADGQAGTPPLPGLDRMTGSHPVPDRRSLRAAEAVRDAVVRAPAGAELLFLISGGASALVAMPAPGLSLDEKAAALRAVAAGGADIRALNTVRKHLSALKGGQLAALSPVPVTTLVASDVIGDDLSVVGSGPTLPDATTFRQACGVVRATAGWDALPRPVRAHLDAGLAGRRAETPSRPRPGDRAFLIAGTGALLDAAVAAAADAGLQARVFARDLVGDVGDVARRIAAQALRAEAARAAEAARGAEAARAGVPWCFVGGGEATIALPPAPGEGGRAQQVALLVARELAGARHVAVLVAGSDGIDGNSRAAGAVVDGSTWDAVIAAGVDPARALARCDAGTALEAAGARVITGPTGINHADLVLVVSWPDAGRAGGSPDVGGM